MKRTLVWAHLVVAVLGVVAIVWQAQPLDRDGLVQVGKPEAWLLAGMAAAFFGGGGGLLEGVAARFGHRVVAVGVLMLASVPALWLPLLLTGRWSGDDTAVPSSRLFMSMVAWLLYLVTVATTCWSVSRRRSPSHVV